ncbi:MGH1-like glycoside hydrolase domain-containing protein [Hydrogenothermus marinus]|uniref:Glycosyl hydrolase family 63 n=1 Tax=Hydrogenothermus marinus TaxID=133270 RepID=A0A3M0B9S7_9AQUI|nr:DUF547 domain-containing protein [Hydrogenothermus marinus]RMA93234.1 glycosyl hydrolase family 63 [Hydrogenothermus marinus]
MIYKYLLEEAKKVLDKNWTGSYTVPSIHLYPHQWNWDSAFIAIGYSRYDTDRAIQELVSLFEGQWKNGMLPHIIFNEKNLGKYFPEPDFWQTENLEISPDNKLTSGITQPPIHAFAVLKIYENAKDKEKVKEFIKWIYPKLIKMHKYFYLERNPMDNGLVYIRHPWESGMDNSPMWDVILERIDINKIKVPKFERKDNKIIDSSQRPKDEDYIRYIYLVNLFKKLDYDEEKIYKECPFLVIDPLFNSILNASNLALIELAKIIGEDYGQQQEWYIQTSRAIRDLLFDKDKKIFFPFDLVENKLIKVETAAGFMPLFSKSASDYQAKLIYQYLNSHNFCKLYDNTCFAVPNFDKTKEGFNSKNYWRGPVWININYLLYHGLKNYDFEEYAYHVEKDILELPLRFGFYEYYDSETGIGYGTKDFSWTAALFIDMVYEYEKRKNKRFISKNIENKIFNNSKKDKFLDTKLALQKFNIFFEKLIKNNVEDFVVNYKKISISPEYKILKETVKNFQKFNFNYLDTENKKKAFWINIYNFMVIDFIISLDIKESVMEIDKFFERLHYKIGDYILSLDDILYGILKSNSENPFTGKKQFIDKNPLILKEKDNRVIFTITQGARSSPALSFYNYTDLDKQIDNATKRFIRGSEILIVPEKNSIFISKLFDWHKDIFRKNNDKIKFIAKYINDEKKRDYLIEKKDININYFYFNWALND